MYGIFRQIIHLNVVIVMVNCQYCKTRHTAVNTEFCYHFHRITRFTFFSYYLKHVCSRMFV